MVYQVENIVRDVRVVLDENRQASGLLNEEDVETLSVYDLIESNIESGVRDVMAVAPQYMLEGGVNIGDEVYFKGSGHGWMPLPSDFMRLVVFKMNDWRVPVYEAIGIDHPRYAQQSSKYKGLRGNPEKPVVAIVRKPVGLVLEFWSSKNSNAHVEYGRYLRYPSIDVNGGIEISRGCYRSAVYQIAALSAMSIGEIEMSRVLREASKEAMV